MNPIDIFITAFQRQELTKNTIKYLRERTNSPYRLFLIDQGGNEVFKDEVDHYISLYNNFGIHAAWNVALSLAESEYFITSDNDIYVPNLKGLSPITFERNEIWDVDWLGRLVGELELRSDYGAISLCPHVFIGATGIDLNIVDNVVERNMCGAVMRIMRRDAVWKAGGWERKIEAGRNHEEKTICSRLQSIGYKVGITSRIRAFHPFPPNWGYPQEFTPEMQKHNPQLEQYVQSFGNMEAYNKDTWLPK